MSRLYRRLKSWLLGFWPGRWLFGFTRGGIVPAPPPGFTVSRRAMWKEPCRICRELQDVPIPRFDEPHGFLLCRPCAEKHLILPMSRREMRTGVSRSLFDPWSETEGKNDGQSS